MSFLLVVVGIYIRLRVSETLAFVQAHAKGVEERAPTVKAFAQYPGTIFRLL